MNFPVDAYIHDSDLHIWKRPDAKPFAYSDGAEKQLKKILDQVTDKSLRSAELLRYRTDWPTSYHLSSARANIIRSFEQDLLANATILELGCGCGAITRYLGEVAREVVAVEGSEQRGAVAASRCQDLENVRVVVDRIQDLPPMPGMFDVVTLIGVLEYCGRYGMTPVEMLGLARSFLKPHGALILALENKMGLKYFAGVPEDHIGGSWSGITNGYSQPGIETWSRKELLALIEAAGFAQADQYLALPDYKLPYTIITSEGLKAQGKSFDLAPLLAGPQRIFELRGLFNLCEAWKSVCRAGMVEDMADSLCFVARPRHVAAGADLPVVLAEHYGNAAHTLTGYAKKIVFEMTESGMRIRKMAVMPGASCNGITHVLTDEPYFEGVRAGDLVRDYLMRKGWSSQGMAEAFRPWVDFIFNLAAGSDMVPGKYLDLTPFNLILGRNGEPLPFDLEWQQDEPIKIDFLLARGFIQVFSECSPVAPPAPNLSLSYFNLLRDMFAFYNLSFKSDELAERWSREELSARIGVGSMAWPQLMERQLHITEDLNSIRAYELTCRLLHVQSDKLYGYVKDLQRKLVAMQKSNSLLQKALDKTRKAVARDG